MINFNELERYDYMELRVNQKFFMLYADYLPCFGWKVQDILSDRKRFSFVKMSLKRKFQIKDKAELLRLQSKFEACMEEINGMETAKSLGAAIAAVSVGLAGVFFLFMAVYMTVLHGLLSILLLLPAIGSWSVAFPCYRIIRNRKEETLQPLIEKKFQDIYLISQSAYRLTQ